MRKHFCRVFLVIVTPVAALAVAGFFALCVYVRILLEIFTHETKK